MFGCSLLDSFAFQKLASLSSIEGFFFCYYILHSLNSLSKATFRPVLHSSVWAICIHPLFYGAGTAEGDCIHLTMLLQCCLTKGLIFSGKGLSSDTRGKRSKRNLAHFLKKLNCMFSFCWVLRVLWLLLDTRPLSDMHFASILLPGYGFVFSLS